MKKSKQMPKSGPDGPEKKFRGKMEEPDGFGPGSRNVMKVKTSRTAVLNVSADRCSFSGSLDIDYSASFDIKGKGVSILIGRLNRDDSFGIPADKLVSLISEPERVKAIITDRIKYIRNNIKRLMGIMEEDKVILDKLRNPRPDQVHPGTTVEVVEEQMESIRPSIQEDTRKAEALEYMLSEGSLTHVLHVRGGVTFSSTQAILSIRPGEITFIPLQADGGRCIDAQNYEMGYDYHRYGVPYEVKISIEFK